MLVALSKRPRCFVLNSTDASVGNAWETDKKQHYRYDTNVTGRMPLNDAGPGSLVLFYNTSNHSRNPMSYTATARVEYIGPGWTGPWTADLSGYQEFDSPVPARQVEIAGRNNQHAITEITWEQYQEIVAAGTGMRPESHDVEAGLDVGGERAAERVTVDFPAADVEILGDEVPVRRADGDLDPSPEREPAYGGPSAGDGSVRIPSGRRSASDRGRDKIVEERAVTVATMHLENLGWRVVADRQKDGVGYDIDLTDGERSVHLEVKGIQGPRLEFNVTAKEWWRVRTDPDFVLAAGTDVLNPTTVHVNLLSPEELVEADRVATQFRVAVRDGQELGPIS
ncbi:protein NO VEIN domain-containing protein [Promicromonospora sp. NPDC090134]|uniref:protein NO VEIN domain-containing protein n=1 Tax=Promicromonospora sp. NPDC090134 TaxID=3364408 RepID=UPI0038069D2D